MMKNLIIIRDKKTGNYRLQFYKQAINESFDIVEIPLSEVQFKQLEDKGYVERVTKDNDSYFGVMIGDDSDDI